MISKIRVIEYEPKDEQFTQQTIIDVYKFLESHLNFSSSFKLLMTTDLVNVFLTIPGILTYQKVVTADGAKLPNTLSMNIGGERITINRQENFKNPYSVQTFHGFDCTETVFKFEKAFNNLEKVEW